MSKPFLIGAMTSNILILNHIYQNELLKQTIRDEIHVLNNIKSF